MPLAEKAVSPIILRKKKAFTERLLKWSPVSANSRLFPWRKTSDPYRVMISELLLRRTRAQNVLPVYEAFVKKFPTINHLASASQSEISDVIETLGITSRVFLIRTIAKNIVKKHPHGFPKSEEELTAVLGNSLYTINAVRCFAFAERVPIFDVNVRRILERVFSLDFGSDPHKKCVSWNIAALLLPECDVRSYNLALLDLGREICTPANPKCSRCPLNSLCEYNLWSGKTEKRPVPAH